MDLNQRINSFLKLGQYLNSIELGTLDEIIEKASYKNPWFTPENIKLSFEGLITYLESNNLKKWISNYNFDGVSAKKIGVVMAGNIPMVGIHDMICILLSGHILKAKLSSQDDILIPFIARSLIKIDPSFEEKIEFVEQLKDIEAVIATGSDNTSRYFEYYFSKYPHIIRRNRTSIAILSGKESAKTIAAIGHDMFSYFGLGCRNVSKLYLREEEKIEDIIKGFEKYKSLSDHNKYSNNYFYHKSIMLINQTVHLDNGFALFQENKKLNSPISIIYYEYYSDLNALKATLDLEKEKIQCIVSNIGSFENAVLPGGAQRPAIWDYADNIDTMQFLSNL